MSVKNIKINNYTHLRDDNALEVLLTGVDKGCLGTDNKISPNFFKRTHITTWMRSNYNITDSRVVAQIPRKITEFPQLARDQFDYDLNDTTISRVLFDEKEIKFCYLIENIDEYVILYWDLKNDEWCMRIKDIDEDYINQHTIWS